MFAFGTISVILDVICFAVLWFIFKFNIPEKAVFFQTGWFAFGIISQTLIIHMIRTNKKPFIESKSSKELLISTIIIVILTLLITFTDIAIVFDLIKLPYQYLAWILILMMLYILVIQIYKKIYLKIYKKWL